MARQSSARVSVVRRKEREIAVAGARGKWQEGREELGEGGLLLHAATARQGVDERVEGDQFRQWRGVGGTGKETTETLLLAAPWNFYFLFFPVLFPF